MYSKFAVRLELCKDSAGPAGVLTDVSMHVLLCRQGWAADRQEGIPLCVANLQRNTPAVPLIIPTPNHDIRKAPGPPHLRLASSTLTA